MRSDRRQGPVAFLFLGETLLIPHLYPVVEALAKRRPDVAIDLWVGTSVHEQLLRIWAGALNSPAIRLRRAPGFRSPMAGEGERKLPPAAKLWMLARLAGSLRSTPVAVCAELTSLWLPRLLPLRTRFIKTAHGAGSVQRRTDPRRRAAWVNLVPADQERNEYLRLGFPPDRVFATGYVKAAFSRAHQRPPCFAEQRPVVLYTPHWQRHRSSWWDWGRQIVAMLAAQHRFNVILAPHQRLIERDPELAAVLAGVAGLPHVHADIDSFAMVDGSYTSAADIYLGDTSSQVVEFLARPRPCVFLDSQRSDWQASGDRGFWRCGEVVDRLDDVLTALDRAPVVHATYRAVQDEFALASLGDTSGAAPCRVVDHIEASLAR
jgi:hypothetical protein